MMSIDVLSILLLCFESLDYVELIFLVSMCIVHAMVFLLAYSLETLSLDSVKIVLVTFEDECFPSGGKCSTLKMH